MKSMLILFSLFIVISSLNSQSVGISNASLPIDPSALLDVNSTEKGFLMPRMTTDQRLAISVPAEGLMVYDIVTSSFWYYADTEWKEIGGSAKYKLAACVKDTFSMIQGTNTPVFNDCGVMYDSGGNDGLYGDGENSSIEIVGDTGGSIRRVIVNNTVLNINDTLTVSNFYFSRSYHGINFDSDTLFLPCNESIQVNLKLDIGPSNGDGFEIIWDTYESISADSEQRSGFFCNTEKQTFGGGIQINDEWTDGTGFRNINFGVFSDTDGESSIAMGTFSKSEELSIAIGHSAKAENQATAIGYNSTANLFGSVAVGKAYAIGNTSTAMGYNTNALGDNSIAIGINARSEATNGITIGKNAIASGTAGLVLGSESSATGDNAVIIGNGISTACTDCIVIGKEGFGAPKVGVNVSNPSTDFEVGGNIKAQKLDIQDDFGEVAITSNNATLQPKLSLYKTSSFNYTGSITSNLQNEMVIDGPGGILNTSNTYVSGTLGTSALTGSGNRDVYANSQGRLIIKPAEVDYYGIPASAFVIHNEEDDPPRYNNYVASNTDFSGDETDEYRLYAPVQLPTGAQIQEVMYSYDCQLSELNIDFRLYRRAYTSAVPEEICYIVGGQTNGIIALTCSDINGSINVVDNENYVYFIMIGDYQEELPSQDFGRFYGVRVAYER